MPTIVANKKVAEISEIVTRKAFGKQNAMIDAPIISEFLRIMCNLFYILAVVPVGIMAGMAGGFEIGMTKIASMYQRHVQDSKIEFNAILKKK